MKRILLPLIGALALASTPALAHVGVGPTLGLFAGFSHPLSGADHILAMTAVGVLAAQRGGRFLWLLPATFVAMMILGGMLGATGVPLPLVEQGILGSIVILGGVIAVGCQIPISAALALVGLFAVFHGHAHATEMPETFSGLEYGFGFVAATAMLHGIGIGLTAAIQQTGKSFARTAVRLGGGAIAAAGLMLIVS